LYISKVLLIYNIPLNIKILWKNLRIKAIVI
jgi:hypothetical protein